MMPMQLSGSHPRRNKVGVDGDGVRTTDLPLPPARRAVRLLALAIAAPILLTVAVVVALRLASGEHTGAPRPPQTGDGAAATAAAGDDGAFAGGRLADKPALAPLRPRPVRRAPAASAGRIEPPPRTDDESEPELDARDVIPALIEAGERGGIALFPPPGTQPILRGIVVPEDFELPEGYVRHYQATDDGRRLPAILMVHPDYELADAHGNPLPKPADGVVPPEMAPPGLPITMLEVPGTAGASGAPGAKP